MSGRELQRAWRQEELIRGKPPVVNKLWLSVESCNMRSEKLVAETGDGL
jgi:hypothetical protein